MAAWLAPRACRCKRRGGSADQVNPSETAQMFEPAFTTRSRINLESRGFLAFLPRVLNSFLHGAKRRPCGFGWIHLNRSHYCEFVFSLGESVLTGRGVDERDGLFEWLHPLRRRHALLRLHSHEVRWGRQARVSPPWQCALDVVMRETIRRTS